MILAFPKVKRYPKDRIWKRQYCDTRFSLYIRGRDKCRCQKCGSYHKDGLGLEAAHFHDRGWKATRYDPANVVSLCHACHAYEDNVDQSWLANFVLRQVGPEAFSALLLKSRSNCTMLQARQQVQLFLSRPEIKVDILTQKG